VDLNDMTIFVLQALRGLDEDDTMQAARRAVIDFFADAEGLQGAAKTYTGDESGELEAEALTDVWIYEWSEETGDFASLGPVGDLVR
jgi:hypothetical protein